MLKSLFALPVLAVLTPAAVLAQDGKVSGRVVDDSGEPLVGVSVSIEGTRLGASTDLDGAFTILRVPPGRYTVVATYVGYTRVRLEGVEVGIDRTATVNLTMREEDLEGEEITVVVERPTVVRDLTGTATAITERQIQAAPVEGVRGVLKLNAAVDQSPDGTFAVRGTNDLKVFVNGQAPSVTSGGVAGSNADKANNSWQADLNPLGVQGLELLSGGFSAEYGNAQGGILKVATREGKAFYEAEYRAEYRPAGQYHWGAYFYGEGNPEYDRWDTFDEWKARVPDSTATARGLRNLYRLYVQWMTNHLPSYTPEETVYNADGTVLYDAGQRVDNRLGVYDYTKLPYVRHLFGVGGPLTRNRDLLRFYVSGEARNAPTRLPTVEQVQRYRNVVATLSLVPSARHRLRFTNVYSQYYGGISSGADDIRYAGRPNSWKYTLVLDSERDQLATSQSLGYTYAPSSRRYAELVVSHSLDETRVPMYPVLQRTDPWSVRPGPWDEDFRTVFSLTSLFNEGSRTRTFTGTAAYTVQVRPTWEVKVGGSLQRWHSVVNGGTSFSPSSFINRTGFGEYSDARPTLAAAYAQTKVEAGQLVANLGLRLDGYSFGIDAPADRFAPFYPGLQGGAIGNPSTVASPVHVRLSPRVGISFPVTQSTAFRLQYGHFSAMPPIRYAVQRINQLGYNTYGNPYLKPERTIAFEVGVQQALFRGTHRLDAVGYYNDRADQAVFQAIRATSGTTTNQNLYSSWVSNGYSASTGLELTFERVRSERWDYRFTYTVSQTRAGRYGFRVLNSADPLDPRNRPTFGPDEALDYADRTHRARALVSYLVPAGQGLRLGTFRPFSGATASLIYAVQSGQPYTYTTLTGTAADNVLNNRRYGFEEQVDLSFSKPFAVAGVAFTAGARIQNLFDNRWITPPPTRGSLDFYQNNGVLLEREAVNLQPYYLYRNVPRQVFFQLGMRLR